MYPKLEVGMSLASQYCKIKIKVPKNIQRNANKVISGKWELFYPARQSRENFPTLFIGETDVVPF